MSDRKKNISRYIISDYICSVMTWIIFIKGTQLSDINRHFLAEAILLSAGWVLLYAFAGSYHRSLYEKSRLNELTSTLIYSFIGVLIVSVIPINHGINSIGTCLTYFLLQFFFIFSGRSFLLYLVKRSLINGDIFFNTLIVGNNADAVKLYKELNKNFRYLGFKTLGFITVNEDVKNGLSNWIPNLGTSKKLG